MRKVIFNAHLIAAFAASAVLLILSISGCVLIAEKKVDGWVQPAPSPAPSQSSLPLADILQKATAAAGGERVSEIHLAGPGSPVMAVTSGESRIYIDRGTGELLARRAGPLPSLWLRRLHKNLLLGPIGGMIVAGATIVLIFQSCSGIFLWWPLKRMSVRLGGSSRRFAFDLHHAAGFASSAFILVICVTGLVRYYPEITEKLLKHPDTAAAAVPPGSEAALPGHRVTIDDAAAIAARQFPGSKLVRINVPRKSSDPFVVSVRYPGDESPFGLSWINVDQASGRVVSLQDVRFESPADAAQRVDRALHTGEIWGVPSRIIAFLTCLAILCEMITGFWMWWKRTGVRPRRPEVVMRRLPTAEPDAMLPRIER